MESRVSDEVWNQLDPKAGHLTGPARWRLVIVAVVGLLLALGVAAGWYSGGIWPQLAVAERRIHGSDGDLVISLTIINDGWFPVDVSAPASEPTIPGVELRRVEGPLPAVIAPHESLGLTYVYRVVDCTRLPATSWHPALAVARPWGTASYPLTVDRSELTWRMLVGTDCAQRPANRP